MRKRICVCCGYDGPAIDAHHIHGRKHSDETVDLCANCHREQHVYTLILVENTASKLALMEMEERRESGEFLNHKKIKAILKKYDYVPLWDGEREAHQQHWEWLKNKGYVK